MVQTTLKETESLAFNIVDPQILLQLQTDLESLNKRYAKEVNVEDGLIVRPKALTKTMLVVHQVKHKYKEIQKRTASYKSLESSSKVGRLKKDWRYRNRVGRKAAKIRKVTCCYCNILYYA